MSTSIASKRSKTSRTMVLLTTLMLGTTMAAPAHAGKRTKGYPKVSKTITQACAGGAALGFGKYALTKKGKFNIGDALVNTAVGAAAGCAFGAVMNNRRQKYATQAAFLDNEILTTRQANEEVQQVNTHLTGIIASNKQEIAKLEQQKASASFDKKEAKKAYKHASADQKWASNQLKSIGEELEYRESAVETVKESGTEPAKVAQYAEETAKLKARKEELVKQVNYLVEQRDAIGQMVNT